jgi:hypothetical protein
MKPNEYSLIKSKVVKLCKIFDISFDITTIRPARYEYVYDILADKNLLLEEKLILINNPHLRTDVYNSLYGKLYK